MAPEGSSSDDLTPVELLRIDSVEQARVRARSTATLSMTGAGALTAGLVFFPRTEFFGSIALVLGAATVCALLLAVVVSLSASTRDSAGKSVTKAELFAQAAALRREIRRRTRIAVVLVAVSLGLLAGMMITNMVAASHTEHIRFALSGEQQELVREFCKNANTAIVQGKVRRSALEGSTPTIPVALELADCEPLTLSIPREGSLWTLAS